MKTIGDLIARDLSQKIEEIIKLDQADEHAVYTELSEYVVTHRMRDQYRELLRAIAEAPSDPHEGVGVWISGFFGSGKSSFAKNVGYVLGNKTVLGHSAADLLKQRLDDSHCAGLIDSINARIPTEVVMFDVQTDKSSGGSGNVSISHYMYRSLLRDLGYAEDFDIAELEISLEGEGKLQEFERRCAEFYGAPWAKRRKLATKMNEASLLLHQMDKLTYTNADSWARGWGDRRVEVTPRLLVDRSFELSARRAKREDGQPKGLVFIIDEVGAYVARSAEKIEDLRRVVEMFGSESKTRVKARKTVGPVWVLVTSQEKLDDIVAAIDSKRVELAKLQDRFKYRIDLAPADIREVAVRRVLRKRPEAEPALRKLFQDHEGKLAEQLKLERSHKQTSLSEDELVEFYPYPPHFVELCIDIMSGIRLQPGAARHLGGSNRTIIKQAYEMLVSERTRLKDARVGRLVTLDLVYDLVEGNLATEKQKDVSDIAARFPNGPWEVRVAKGIALLEFVRDLPRTEHNIAACLVESIGATAPRPEVKAALERLVEHQFVRNTEDGYKLQTQSEKTWDGERRGMDPKPREKAEVVRGTMEEIFKEPKLRSYVLKDLKRTFKVGLTVDGNRRSDGEIPLSLVFAHGDAELMATQRDIQAGSRAADHENDVYWVFALTEEIDLLAGEVVRSQSMVQKYTQLSGQGSLTGDEPRLLGAEKNEELRFRSRVRDRIVQAIEGGRAYFRGEPKDASALGKTIGEVFRALFDWVVPKLYSKLSMGARHLEGREPEDVLKAANLAGLAQVLYDGDDGLGLVVKDPSGKYVPQPEAPIAKEILDYLRQRNAYGEKVTGKGIEERFTGLGYGWEKEIIHLVLAVLLRAGAVEMTFQGRRFRNHQDAQSRAAFGGATAFRGASFAPRESIALKTLATAAEHFEALSGQEVDIEEGAIAQAFRKLAEGEHGRTLPARATARAHALSALEQPLAEYEVMLRLGLDAPSDDVVRMLANEGKTLKRLMDQARRIREALNEDAVARITAARSVLEVVWPVLQPERDDLAAAAHALQEVIAAADLLERLTIMEQRTHEIDSAFGRLFDDLHTERQAAVVGAIDHIKGLPEWGALVPFKRPEDKTAADLDLEARVLRPLTSRMCPETEGNKRSRAAAWCGACQATLGQLRSDHAAVDALRRGIVESIRRQLEPEKKTVRVRVGELTTEPLTSTKAVETLIERLREELLKAVAEGHRVILE